MKEGHDRTKVLDILYGEDAAKQREGEMTGTKEEERLRDSLNSPSDLTKQDTLLVTQKEPREEPKRCSLGCDGEKAPFFSLFFAFWNHWKSGFCRRSLSRGRVVRS